MRGRVVIGGVAATAMLVSPTAALATTADGASLTGEVFVDLDGDGSRDADEPGLGDVQLTLRTAAAILDATVTAADGSWAFNNVMDGTVTLVVEPPNDLAITGGSVDGLDRESGEAPVEIDGDAELGAIGLGSPLADGPDVAATVAFDEDASTDDSHEWRLLAANLGGEAAAGPIELRAVLSAGHEAVGAEGDGWSCETSPAIVLCSSEGDLSAGTALPAVTLTTMPDAEVGTTVTVTGTVRLDGSDDDAPLNDEAEASATVGSGDMTEDLDGDGTDDITNAGAPVTGLLVAALLALVVGAAAVATGRTTRRP